MGNITATKDERCSVRSSLYDYDIGGGHFLYDYGRIKTGASVAALFRMLLLQAAFRNVVYFTRSIIYSNRRLSHTSLIAMEAPLTLLTLPKELRLEIYDHVFAAAHASSIEAIERLQHEVLSKPSSSYAVNDITSPALLCVCRQLRDEAWSHHARGLSVFSQSVRRKKERLEELVDSRALECMPNFVDPSMVRRMHEVVFEAVKGLHGIEKEIVGRLASMRRVLSG